ncbi:MAG: flavodoxin family protein [Actinobacteria bacterium]|nr:flavodoxin family protein [Actinomycetota bacterium]
MAMIAVVAFESTFGNTRAVAEAIGRGLSAAGVSVRVQAIAETPARQLEAIDLLVVGAPVCRGHGTSEAMQTWLSRLPDGCGRPAAVFDTYFHKTLASDTVPPVTACLHERRWNLVVPPVSFVEQGPDQPLVWGEAGHAEAWGALVASSAAKVATP